MNVLITGGAGQITYAFIPLLLSGQVFGLNVKINLILLDIEPCIERLTGVKFEIEDSNFNCLGDLTITSDIKTAFTNIDLAICLGGFPRSKDMDRNDLISKNFMIFKQHGEALNKYSSTNVKVLVVANPANTNCWIINHFAPNIPSENFTSLSYLDQERLSCLLQNKYSKSSSDIKNIVIWGNHSDTMVPDTTYYDDTIQLDTDDIHYIRNRGSNVIQKRGFSSALSAANAIQKHLHIWYFGSDNETVSFGVYNKSGCFKFPTNLVISLPVKISPGFNICIQNDLHIRPNIREMVNESIVDLQKELAFVLSLL